MHRFAITALAAAVLALPARAHFIFILPDKAGGDRTSGQLVFSDSLTPDDPKLLAKVAGTELFIRDARGETAPLKFTQDKDRFGFSVEGSAPAVVGGEIDQGVRQVIGTRRRRRRMRALGGRTVDDGLNGQDDRFLAIFAGGPAGTPSPGPA